MYAARYAWWMMMIYWYWWHHICLAAADNLSLAWRDFRDSLSSTPMPCMRFSAALPLTPISHIYDYGSMFRDKWLFRYILAIVTFIFRFYNTVARCCMLAWYDDIFAWLAVSHIFSWGWATHYLRRYEHTGRDAHNRPKIHAPRTSLFPRTPHAAAYNTMILMRMMRIFRVF